MRVRRFIRSIVLIGLCLGIAVIASAQTVNTPELSSLLASGKLYHHPLGFTFRHPADWTVQKTDEALALVPPEANSEVYLILNEEVQDISRPDDSRLAQALEQQISALAPFLKRVGEITSVKAGETPGALITWEGKNPTGVDTRACIFVAISKGHAIYFLAVGATDRIVARDAMSRAIFSTFTFGDSEATPSTSSATSNPLAPQSQPTPPNPLVTADPYAGTFKSDQMTVELKESQGQYTGSIHFNGQEFPIVAHKAGDSLEGTFESQGNPFTFTASLKGATLTLSTGGVTHTLEKQVAANNPLAQLGASAASPTQKSGKAYHHPTGYTFRYPENWKVQESDDGIQLIPPEVSSNAQGPTEVYLISGESAQGISSPTDPRFIQYLDTQLMSLLPFLRRTGEVESVKTGNGTGIVMTWEGKNPTGMQIRARVFATILKKYGVALVALGDKSRIEAREASLRDIFSTFDFEEGKTDQREKDPRLVGNWRHEEFYSSGDFSSTSIRYMTFQADGAFRSGSRLFAGTGSVSADTGESPGEQGRWFTDNSKIYLTWDDGSYAEYRYYIEGTPGSRSMLFKPAHGKNQLWEEVQ